MNDKNNSDHHGNVISLYSVMAQRHESRLGMQAISQVDIGYIMFFYFQRTYIKYLSNFLHLCGTSKLLDWWVRKKRRSNPILYVNILNREYVPGICVMVWVLDGFWFLIIPYKPFFDPTNQGYLVSDSNEKPERNPRGSGWSTYWLPPMEHPWNSRNVCPVYPIQLGVSIVMGATPMAGGFLWWKIHENPWK